jgi:hypothetical protein
MMPTMRGHHDWLRRVSDYHSGGVSGAERAAVEAHLLTCSECREALAMYQRFYRLLRSPLALDGALLGMRLAPDGAGGGAGSPGTRGDSSTGIRPLVASEPPRTPNSPPRQDLWLIETIAAVLVIALLGGGLFALLHNHAGTAHQPTPSPTVTRPSPTTGPAALLQTSLAPAPSDWVSGAPTGCLFQSDGLHIKNAVGCALPVEGFEDQTGYWQNGRITVSVKQIAGPATGTYGMNLGGRSNPGPNGIASESDRFDIDSTGRFFFQECYNNACQYVVTLTANPAIHAGLGATNTLEVRITGGHFDLYVNGTKVGQADSSTYPNTGGHASLECGDNIEVVYTNLTLATDH